MQDELVCPVISDQKEGRACGKDKCAWWDEKNQACALLVQAQMLERIAKALEATSRTLWERKR